MWRRRGLDPEEVRRSRRQTGDRQRRGGLVRRHGGERGVRAARDRRGEDLVAARVSRVGDRCPVHGRLRPGDPANAEPGHRNGLRALPVPAVLLRVQERDERRVGRGEAVPAEVEAAAGRQVRQGSQGWIDRPRQLVGAEQQKLESGVGGEGRGRSAELVVAEPEPPETGVGGEGRDRSAEPVVGEPEFPETGVGGEGRNRPGQLVADKAQFRETGVGGEGRDRSAELVNFESDPHESAACGKRWDRPGELVVGEL